MSLRHMAVAGVTKDRAGTFAQFDRYLEGTGGTFKAELRYLAADDEGRIVGVLGGLSIGALALGGVAIGCLALGGAAIGGVAIGGLAIGYYAVGGRRLWSAPVRATRAHRSHAAVARPSDSLDSVLDLE